MHCKTTAVDRFATDFDESATKDNDEADDVDEAEKAEFERFASQPDVYAKLVASLGNELEISPKAI